MYCTLPYQFILVANTPVTCKFMLVPDITNVKVGVPPKSSWTAPCIDPTNLKVPALFTYVALIIPPMALVGVDNPPTTKASIVYAELDPDAFIVNRVVGVASVVVTPAPNGKTKLAPVDKFPLPI